MAAQHESVVLRQVLDHPRHLHPEQVRGRDDRLLHQVGGAGALERMLAQPGDRRLLCGAELELGFGLLLVGYVRHHSVPALGAVIVIHQQRVIADPDDVTVAVQQPVLERAGRRVAVDDAVLQFDDPPSIVGVKTAGPKPRVRAPLLGREAEDRLDLGTYVTPGAVFARVGGIQDRGYAVQKTALVAVIETLPVCSGRRRPRAGVTEARRPRRHVRVLIGVNGSDRNP